MSTLMTDPVLLPSSRVTVDRATIARHLLRYLEVIKAGENGILSNFLLGKSELVLDLDIVTHFLVGC